jgi:hypothetical protein
MAKLTTVRRKALPKKDFGLPAKKGADGKNAAGRGGYPMPDKKHAAVAKAFADRYATPYEKAKIDAKANRILGKTNTKGR